MTEAPIKILVVDDEPELESLIRMEFRKKIRKKEFEFLFAAHGAEALGHIEAGTDLDVILCDLNMPVMDGLTLLSHLSPKKLILKSIVVSAYGDMRNIRSAMNLGAFDFVTKPIEFEDLETTIFKAFKEISQLKEAQRTKAQLQQTTQHLSLAEAQSEQLQELDALKTRLFTNFSHEFRTPLTIIKGMAEQIQEHPHKWTEPGSSMIRRNADYLLHLVNQILDLRKIEAGKLALQAKAGNLVFLARYAFESFHSLAASKDILLSFESQADELWGIFDEAKLLQIFSNLLSNAIKYTPIGGQVSCRCVWDIEGDTARLQIQVSDTGIGIPEDQLPHIFEQFYQAHGETEIQGTGIGLALTQELINLMEGTIEVMSKEGEGSSFAVQLPIPLAAEQQPTNAQIQVAHKDSKPVIHIDPDIEDGLPSLLIVEDNPDIQQYLIACLENRYRLRLANDGQAGIDKALEEIPDIIVSDVMMPRKDGFELCRTLKTDERTSHIPIILLTAKVDIDSKLEGLGLGADAYLSKPFDKGELLIRLEKLIDVRRMLQARYQSAQPLAPSTHPITQKQDAFIERFRQILMDNIDDTAFHVPEMCEAIAMSRSSLHRKVKALTGLSTTHFMQEIRLQRSNELLKNLDLSIADIAYMSGFSTPVYFSKRYKAKYGVSPRAGREQI